jgi:hypothetical protein
MVCPPLAAQEDIETPFIKSIMHLAAIRQKNYLIVSNSGHWAALRHRRTKQI